MSIALKAHVLTALNDDDKHRIIESPDEVNADAEVVEVDLMIPHRRSYLRTLCMAAMDRHILSVCQVWENILWRVGRWAEMSGAEVRMSKAFENEMVKL